MTIVKKVEHIKGKMDSLRFRFKNSVYKFLEAKANHFKCLIARKIKPTFGILNLIPRYHFKRISYDLTSFKNSEYFAGISSQYKLLQILKKQNLRNLPANKSNFIYTPIKPSAQYYAGYLWNWRLINAARNEKRLPKYMRKYISLTLTNMNAFEFDTFLTFLLSNTQYVRFFQNLTRMKNKKENITHINQQILTKPQCTFVILNVMNRWLLSMPILCELSRLVHWDVLKETEVIFLNVDNLYNLYVNIQKQFK